MNCTLKVNMILGDGQHYPRGSVVGTEMLPIHLRTSNYIASGVVTINKVMPIDTIEIKDIGDDEEEAASPMHELTLSDIESQQEQWEEPEEKPIVRKPLLKRRKLR